MKVIMEFDLLNDAGEYHAAWHGPTYRSALRGLDDKLRQIIKYEDRPEPVMALCQELRDLLREACQEAMQDGDL